MWRHWGLALGLALICGGTLAADDQEKDIDRWALLIGVDDYAELEGLKCAAADQRAFAQRLVACGFPPDHVFLLESKAAEAKFLPSKLNIEKQLEVVLRLAARGDVVVLGFSGHGVQIDGASYLCPMEARWDEPSSMIPLDDIYKRLQACRADLKLALIDACREQDPRLAGKRSLAGSRSVGGLGKSAERPPRGVMILTSCDFGQIAWEDEKQLGHGVFMYNVLEGLKGQADRDGDGQVSLHELSRYAAERTKTYVARRFITVQEPALRGEVALEVLDYPLALLNTASLPRTGAPQPPLPAAPVKPGAVSTNSIGMKLVAIPAGEFMMGSPEGEVGRDKDEGPVHRVRITRPFEIGMYEVTVGQFRRFVAATNHRTEAETDGVGGWGWTGEGSFPFSMKPSFNWRTWWANQTDEHPVVNVSWNDALAFCQWLSQQEGATYRLPTEAEWEYACRAGTTTRFYGGDGDESLEGTANVADASAKRVVKSSSWTYAAWDDGYSLTAPVGKFRPNGFGLYDMHGNVWEWCSDWYGEDYYAANIADDPKGPSSGSFRVIRGGGWGNRPSDGRSAFRGRNVPADRDNSVGFRVVRGR